MGVIGRRLVLLALVIMMSIAEGRFLRLSNSNSSDEFMISDGIDGGGGEPCVSSCRHQYGFLPCAENGVGYFFMIVVYQVLLVVGDMLMGSGSELLFHITGAEFGGILFRILRALPSMTLMILSGILSDREHAQSQVSVVVGVYAGITVFSLTVQWFVCMVSASTSLKEEESKEHAETSHSIKEKLRILIDNGVKVDEETCVTAKIMLLSLIPYVVLLPVYFFNTLSGKRFITLIALIVSSLSLISYFVYQIRYPWMQRRSLKYSGLGIVQRGFIQHVERLGKLVKEDGTLNTNLITEFFNKADKNEDKCIAVEEMEKIVHQVFKAGKSTDIDPNNAVKEVMNKFDNNRDKRINEDEFIQGFKQWIEEAKRSASHNDFNPREMFHKALQLLKEKKENNSPTIDRIMSKILKQAEGQLMRTEALITNDGEPNIERIRSLFKEFDSSKDGSLSEDELKQLITKVKFGTYQMKDDDVIKEMFRAFDLDGDEVIDEQEFINGVKGFLEKAMKSVNTSERTRVVEEFDKIVWKQKIVYTKQDFFKSVFQVLLGIAMLTFLAGPLMENILQLSNAMNFPSFIISFVVVPIAMNARAAIAALLPASKKREDTASLIFSEIYGGVIMNNIAGLTTLLAIVYAKDLTWDFSAEVLTILVVCAVIGTQAFLSTTYHLWTCIPAFFLYPISLGFFYVFQVFFTWN
ncbi:hypothetical protein C2S52_006683 [Perilla frutescens var. hirtella]|nr:hypothetical protein C2S51_009030 [Perilla frutescens var. frutescens]KAH6787131.1 hypothetical protein C2S52_006683 [Perilla frutescens var. hirtella]